MQDFNALLEEMRQQYMADLPARLEGIENNVLELSNTDNFQETFEEIYRNVHSIKGSAGTHGLHSLTLVAHHLENAMGLAGEQGKTFTTELQDNWLALLDLLRTALEAAQAERDISLELEQRITELSLQQQEKPFRCLLVETQKTNIQLITAIFDKLPIQLEISQDGYKALQRLLLEPFDILMSSAQVPVLNGPALIAAAQLSIGNQRNIETVLFTTKQYENHLRKTDPDHVILKDGQMINKLEELANKLVKRLQMKQ